MKTTFNGTLKFIHIKGFRVSEPSKEAKQEIRKKAEGHLRSKYAPGLYQNPTECNEILKFLFTFYDSLLTQLLPKIATAWWVAGIIFQHEQSGKISLAYRAGELSSEDADYWRIHGAVIRQALDYLCEKLNELGEIDKLTSSQDSQVPDFERAFVCAKSCVEYSSISNYTHMVIPHATSLRIHPIGNDHYFEHIVNPEINHKIKEYQIQNNSEVGIRDKYFYLKPSPFDLEYHLKILDVPFKEEFGISYTQFQGLVASLVVNSKEIKDPRQVPMQLIQEFFYNAAHNNGISEEIATTILSEIIMDKSVPRTVWNSKQPNRINKKPILKFTSKGRTVLMWSHDKIMDFFRVLDADITFNKVPPDWKTRDLRIAVTEISNYAGKWFEKATITQLINLGFVGKEIKLDTFKKYPSINFDCGQIDFLAYHPKGQCLCIFEFKMIETGFDAKGIRQVSDHFLNGNDSFVSTFNKKISWVKLNIDFIRTYFNADLSSSIPNSIQELKTIFLTYYPTQMGLFYDEIPCKSLIEFVDDCNSEGIWPYQ